MALTKVSGSIIGTETVTNDNISDTVRESFGPRNRIINGDMRIDQRNAGAALAVTAGTVQYSVDRFFGLSSNAQCTFQQIATSDSDFPFALRLARTVGGTGTGIIQGGQIIETNNCQDLAGQTATFSFYATAGANFSAASSQITVGLTCGSGTNQGASAAFITGTWTNITAPLSTAQTITTTRTKYTYTVSIPSGTNEIGIRWYYTPVGTAGANDWFQITGVQLEVGSVATPFERRPFGTELSLCQRYYYKIGTTDANVRVLATSGFVESSTRAIAFVNFPVSMRTAPTAVEQTGTAANYLVRYTGGNDVACSVVPTFNVGNTWGARSLFDIASGLLTAGQSVMIQTTAASGVFLAWSAEL